MEVPKIFESEYRFCEILWAHEPVTSSELVRLCNEALEWKKSTTYTVIRRLSEMCSQQRAPRLSSGHFQVRCQALSQLLCAKRISQDRKLMRFKRLLMRIRISLCKRLRFFVSI